MIQARTQRPARGMAEDDRARGARPARSAAAVVGRLWIGSPGLSLQKATNRAWRPVPDDDSSARPGRRRRPRWRRVTGRQVARLTELDLGVYRVSRRDGPDWVARVFAADRPLAAAEGDDVALLGRLEQQEFPAVALGGARAGLRA